MRALAALCLAAAAPIWAQGDAAPAGQVGISVRATPQQAAPGATFTLDGVVPLDGKGKLRLTITPPAGRPPTVLEVPPAANGDWRAQFGSTQVPGDYRVDATSPGGQLKGVGRFTVLETDFADDFEQATGRARAEAQAAVKAVDGIVADVDAQIARLPDNPARDALKAKWAELKPKLQRVVRDLGDIDALVTPLKAAVAGEREAAPALAPATRALNDWTTRSRAERERILRQLSASRREGATCENLERVIEGFKWAMALSNLLDGFNGVMISAAKELVEGALLRTLKPHMQGKLAGYQRALEATAKLRQESNGNLVGWLSEAVAWMGTQQFDKFCSRFSGRFDGLMHAEFFARVGGEKWWSYDMQLRGQLELRYAKSPLGDGQSVAVRGEFVGQAVRFTLAEDAIRVGWPKLTAGARLYKRALLPMPILPNIAPPEEGKPIEIDGKASAAMVQPYGFFVPVEGEIVDNVLTLRVQAATSDFDAKARVVYVIVSPLSLVPVATAFELPYKDAGFFFLRAAGGQPMRFKVEKSAKALRIVGEVDEHKGAGVAKGRYQLKFNLCNPAGAC
ncbi:MULTISPECIES: hypothetical protein [unclassified Roseateles]|uniref:hypothetical protein n=1 Tax=unclassified Roseateles TaxID=2626991 RepID=UPI0007001B28|nr:MULTISPECIES: hypothetical protein [unclassified Roseateles]KQW44828.1 hypothetical protein ASC81_14770 [Pelomonas sp. Root405]KRA70187.1 hypothetical protein ASD88_18930 [Pelomonas sp. Root662]